MFQKKHLIMLLLIGSQHTEAQQKSLPLTDSLSAKTYDYFSTKTLPDSGDSLQRLFYAQSWLVKAKSEKNCNQSAQAYKALLYNDDKKLRLLYADSMIAAAKAAADPQLIGAAYMTKGIIHYDRKEHKKALDNYLLADSCISQTKDNYTLYKIKYGIAHTKYYLGFYSEAIALFKQCCNYFKEENDRAYLNTLHSLGLCYNRTGQYKLCSQTNQLGLKEGIRLDNTDMAAYFNHSEGVNQYFMRNYKKAIRKLAGSLVQMQFNKDLANETVAYFYIGKCYWERKEKEKAVIYFKKIDEAFQEQGDIRPDAREAYELLINYYKQRKDKESQLHYISQLLKVDNLLHKNYRYLSGKIHWEYDTKKLLLAKKEIEKSMEYRTVYGFLIMVLMSFVIAFLIYRHYKNKRLFEELMNRKPQAVTPIVPSGNKTISLDISPEVVKNILKNLEKFEHNKKYLEKDMTLVKMATILHTNTKYVSKIITQYRNKGTIEYVSDLRIDHIVELLKNENKYRNYTNKALGEEAGFGSTQNFTRAFNNRTGLSPTYFIQKLKAQYNNPTEYS